MSNVFGILCTKNYQIWIIFDRVIQKNEKGGFFSEQFTD